MTRQELSEMLYNHEFTKQEETEAKSIADICSKEGFRCGSGCPLYVNGNNADDSPRYRAAGDCYVSIVAISKNEQGFNYYVIEVGDRGDYRVTDFQEKWLPRYEEKMRKHYNDCAIPFDCFLHYLLDTRLITSNKKDAEYIINERYCLKATFDESTKKYKLEPLHGYGSGMALDEVLQYGCSYGKPVYELIECPHCYTRFVFNDSQIPNGEKYEIDCPDCGTLLIRKKV